MKINKKHLIVSLFLVLVLFLAYLIWGVTDDPADIARITRFRWLALKNVYLWGAQILGLSLWLAYLYQCWSVTHRFYFSFNCYDGLVLLVFGFLVLVFIPGYIFVTLFSLFSSFMGIIDLYLNVGLSKHRDPLLSEERNLALFAAALLNFFFKNYTVNEILESSFGKKISFPSESESALFFGRHEKEPSLESVTLDDGMDYCCVDIEALFHEFLDRKTLAYKAIKVFLWVLGYSIDIIVCGDLSVFPDLDFKCFRFK